jgi:hypothetical protein
MTTRTALRFLFVAAATLPLIASAACGSDDQPFTSTSSVGGSGGSGGEAEGGSPPGCDPAECDGEDTECAFRACDANDACVMENAAAGAVCTDGGEVCDGDGACVACVDDGDCDDTDVCVQNACLPAACINNQLDPDESDVDCGGPCLPCDNGMGCGDAADCVSLYCDKTQGPTPEVGICAACATDAHCADAAGTYCKAGACVAQKADGDVCAGSNECLNGSCPAQDGVCCDTACDATCESCLSAKTGGATGACGAVIVDTDPDAECSDEGAASCGATGNGCNGDGAAPGCNLYDNTTECSPPVCAGGQQTIAELCDGAGTCVQETASACGTYACNVGGTACLTACQSDSACASNAYCNIQNNTCVLKKTNGAACGAANECASGFCPGDDGVCCNAACDTTCTACLASKTASANGTCGNILVTTDPDNECPLGSCNGLGACGL